MKNSEFKIIITIFTLVFALGIFLGGFTLYNRFGIEEPLTDELVNIKGVKQVSVRKDKDYEIEINLQNISNFNESYKKILAISEIKLGKNNFDLILMDKPNVRLNEIFISLQPLIYEALAKNELVWLNDNLTIMAEEELIDYKLFVDEENLYIHLADGEFYVYKVIKRLPELETIS